MKHILFGLAAVLFASSVALADDQLTAQVNTCLRRGGPTLRPRSRQGSFRR